MIPSDTNRQLNDGEIKIGMAIDWTGDESTIPENYIRLNGRSYAIGTYQQFEEIFLRSPYAVVSASAYTVPTVTLTYGIKIVRVS